VTGFVSYDGEGWFIVELEVGEGGAGVGFEGDEGMEG